ncbi:hypothetical protein [Acetobacterium wieringae]|nr:hypothetical protein [Acetobacterium wieringae]
MKEIKGKFILSYSNDDFVRELYQGFNLIKISRRNSLLSGMMKKIKNTMK